MMLKQTILKQSLNIDELYNKQVRVQPEKDYGNVYFLTKLSEMFCSRKC